MAISKRLRFEILRRDKNTCRYCGRKSPDVQLHVDHVVPETLGGTDDPTNLVAACADCNSGKSSVTIDGPLVADVNSDAVRWRRAIIVAAQENQIERAQSLKMKTRFDEQWTGWTYGNGKEIDRPTDWWSSIEHFLSRGLTIDDVIEFVGVAMSSKVPPAATWKYFCGCCWKRIDKLEQRAQELIDNPPPESPDHRPALLTTVWTVDELLEELRISEGYAAGVLSQESIDSACCRHLKWGEGTCGDPVCVARQAEAIGWMADSEVLKLQRETHLMDALDAWDEQEELADAP